MFKNVGICILLIVLSLPTVFPLFHEGFFSMHDDTQVVRVGQMYKAIQDGQFPVRWVADLGYGYGYPIFNFYGPLPYYIGALCMFLGASVLLATKLMFIVGILGASITMFLLARNIWGTFPGIVAAIIYQYAPYHAVDIYVRGAVSEFWAIALLPLIFLGIVLIEKTTINKKYTNRVFASASFLISISYACLVVTHNITVMLVSLFLGIGILGILLYVGFFYFVQHKLRKKLLIKTLVICGSLVTGLGLSAFFWIPAFAETSYTNVSSVIGGGADYHDHFVYLDQLWDSPWGYGGSVQGKADGLSFKVGKIPIVLSLFSLVLLAWQFFAKSASKRLIVYSIYIVVTILVAIFMSTSFSQFIWDKIPIFAYIQFPWRFLVFIILGLSLLSGALFTIRKDFFIYSISILLVVFIIFVNRKYFVPQQYIVLDNSVYSSDQYAKWWVSRLSDEYMPKEFKKPIGLQNIVTNKFIINNEIQIKKSMITTTRYQIDYISPKDSALHVNVAYFPGWMVLLDKNFYQFSIKNDGIDLMLPAGDHILEIRRSNTTIETIANTISLFCLVSIFGTMVGLRYSYDKKV